MSERRTLMSRTPVIHAVTTLATVVVFVVLVMRWSAAPPSADRVLDATTNATAHFPATSVLERSWITEAFRLAYATRTVAGPPCVEDIRMDPEVRSALAGALALESNEQLSQVHRRFSGAWLPGLILGQRLLRVGDTARALDVLADVYGRPRFRSLMNKVVDGARHGDPRRAPSTVETLGVIHLLHAYGLAQMETRRSVGEDYWRALKNPIGAVRVLSRRGVTGTLADAPSHDEHRLPAPGCPVNTGRDSERLTSLDLYNNLIVGYLHAAAFEETEARRAVEFRRRYEDTVEDNPLQHVLRAAVAELIPSEEYWVWAVSNAERLLRDRRLSQLSTLTNPLLALNLAQLIDEARARDLAPAATAALWAERNRLVAAARDHRNAVDPASRPAFDLVLAHALLVTGVESATPVSLPADVRANLDPDAVAVADAVLAAVTLRVDPERAAQVAVSTDEDAVTTLLGPALAADGPRAERWRSALRTDVAGMLATRASSQGDPSTAVRLARRLMRPGDAVPAAFVNARASLGALDRMHLWWAGWRGLGRWMLATLAAALVWCAGRWWAVQWRRRSSLFTSFYRREAKARLRS